MKRIIPVVVFVVLLSATACAGEHSVAQEAHSAQEAGSEHSPSAEQNRALPFNIRHYGHFQKMVQNKDVAGTVDLKTALSAPNMYAVGALAGGAGEITVNNSQVWLAYGKDGLEKTTTSVLEGEEALLLVAADVETWREVALPNEMSEEELHQFIVDQAAAHDIDTSVPFPFLLEGHFDLDWHVINGPNPDFQGHGGPPFLIQVEETVEQKAATIIGFYSADIQGVFTHPGESWHLHVLFAEEEKAGHVDKLLVRDAVLKLPEK